MLALEPISPPVTTGSGSCHSKDLPGRVSASPQLLDTGSVYGKVGQQYGSIVKQTECHLKSRSPVRRANESSVPAHGFRASGHRLLHREPGRPPLLLQRMGRPEFSGAGAIVGGTATTSSCDDADIDPPRFRALLFPLSLL